MHSKLYIPVCCDLNHCGLKSGAVLVLGLQRQAKEGMSLSSEDFCSGEAGAGGGHTGWDCEGTQLTSGKLPTPAGAH